MFYTRPVFPLLSVRLSLPAASVFAVLDPAGARRFKTKMERQNTKNEIQAHPIIVPWFILCLFISHAD